LEIEEGKSTVGKMGWNTTHTPVTEVGGVTEVVAGGGMEQGREKVTGVGMGVGMGVGVAK
jgi:hypothetical protein